MKCTQVYVEKKTKISNILFQVKMNWQVYITSISPVPDCIKNISIQNDTF